jgi:LAO/AO transport system kinase
MAEQTPSSVPELAEAVRSGQRKALARAISLVENRTPEGGELMQLLYPSTGAAKIYGFTGPPGAGKSTLIGALVKERREAGKKVAVLSVDPSSPFTHGAVLGDRIRLVDHFLDPGVFIRSMANRGALGGLAEGALEATMLLDAAGFEEVFIETVGVGQAEVDIIDHADTVVLVLMPGSGDSVQALKAGVMEIPDLIVVNKADHPLTDTLVREIKGVLALGEEQREDRWSVPVVRTIAQTGEGVAELAALLEAHHRQIEELGVLAARRRRNLRNEVLALATARLRRRLEGRLERDGQLGELLDQVVERKLDPASAAERLLEEAKVGSDGSTA